MDAAEKKDAMGQPDEALENYEEALTIYRELV